MYFIFQRIVIRIGILLLLISANDLKAQGSDEEAIKHILLRQASCWNKGNLDSFMVGYWQDDSLLFMGKSGPKYGYENTLNNYKKSYPDTGAMGQLHFEFLRMEKLSRKYFFVVGKWHLRRSLGSLEGYFTLLFKKIDHQWVIVADHSS